MKKIKMNEHSAEDVASQVWQWLDRAVIGQSLCPFAARPRREGRVQVKVSGAQAAEAVLLDLQTALIEMSEHAAAEWETLLLIVPGMFSDFRDYNDFLAVADNLLRVSGLEGIFQIASFHPDYCFADAEQEDPANFSNRSPYPIFHILREDSVESVLQFVDEPEDIPKRNIALLRGMSSAELVSLFPYAFK